MKFKKGKYKSEIFFITDNYIILRFTDKNFPYETLFRLRRVKTNFEYNVSKEKVNEIVYGKRC